MTAGEFTSFVLALLFLYEPVKRLTGIHKSSSRRWERRRRSSSISTASSTSRTSPAPSKLAKLRKSAIALDDVSFRYPDAPDGFALDGVDLEVKAGEMVALVGPSGAGKTTLANLVPRFYDVTGGSMRIDGRDIRDLQLASLRDQDRHRGPGHVPVQRHGGQQHPLRQEATRSRMRSMPRPATRWRRNSF